MCIFLRTQCLFDFFFDHSQISELPLLFNELETSLLELMKRFRFGKGSYSFQCSGINFLLYEYFYSLYIRFKLPEF